MLRFIDLRNVEENVSVRKKKDQQKWYKYTSNKRRETFNSNFFENEEKVYFYFSFLPPNLSTAAATALTATSMWTLSEMKGEA